ncbi:MAG: hypothetical protein J2P46_09860 [Zavarzinella sp.]|nr:hypothetical protein [Zavarzinella sp.]
MHPDDVVDWTIRNQRYRGPWPGWLWIVGWMLFWMGASGAVELWTPSDRRSLVYPSTLGLMLISFVILMLLLEGRQSVRRLKLGEDLLAAPVGRLKPMDIGAIRLAPDRDEDYVESKLPVPLCEVAVEGRRGRPIRLVVSAGDAARLREWAQRNGVAVIDPEGYSTLRAWMERE